jgi:indole-3-glycerol phosphate synthase
MPDTKVGNIVHITRGYTVAEIVEPRPGADDVLLGYSVFGYRSDTALVFETKERALEVLKEVADAWEADARNSRRLAPDVRPRR